MNKEATFTCFDCEKALPVSQLIHQAICGKVREICRDCQEEYLETRKEFHETAEAVYGNFWI